MRVPSIPVGILIGLLGAVRIAAAEDTPRRSVPLSVQGGRDTPLGTGGLSLSVETARGWGLGAGIGFRDATPGTIHTLVGINFRAPIFRRDAFDLSAVLWLSGGGRETETHHPSPGTWFMRWSWGTAYRVDAAASARLHLDSWAVRLDAGVGYVVNPPRCEYVDTVRNLFLVDGDCADPIIPAGENAASPWVRVTPFVALAGEYDIGGSFSDEDAPETETATATGDSAPPDAAAPAEPVTDGRASNAWLAPTALTLGQGKVRLSAYEGIAPELAVGITDWFQATAAYGYFGSSIHAYRAELKAGVLRQGRVRLAVLAGGIGGRGENGFSLALWGAGGAVSLCLDEGCRSMASVAALGGVLIEHGESGSGNRSAAGLVSPSLVVALGSRAKLAAEMHVHPGDDPILVAVFRLSFRHLGLELGVLAAGGFVVPVGTISWLF